MTVPQPPEGPTPPPPGTPVPPPGHGFPPVAAPPPKRGATPWILGGVGLVVLIVVAVFVFVATGSDGDGTGGTAGGEVGDGSASERAEKADPPYEFSSTACEDIDLSGVPPQLELTTMENTTNDGLKCEIPDANGFDDAKVALSAQIFPTEAEAEEHYKDLHTESWESEALNGDWQEAEIYDISGDNGGAMLNVHDKTFQILLSVEGSQRSNPVTFEDCKEAVVAIATSVMDNAAV